MKCSVGIAVLFALGGFVSVFGDEHAQPDMNQPDPNDSLTRSDDRLTNEPVVTELDAPTEIDPAQPRIESGGETVSVQQPLVAARPFNETLQSNESEVELELLKLINHRLRQEVQDKSRIIQTENQRNQFFMLLGGAAILLVGGGIGFFFGFRMSKNDLRL